MSRACLNPRPPPRRPSPRHAAHNAHTHGADTTPTTYPQVHRLSALCRWSAPSVAPDADRDPPPSSLPPRRPTPKRLPSVPSAGLLFDMDTEDGGGGGGGCPASPTARGASTAPRARACARGRPDVAALAALVQPWTPAEADLARQVALAIDAAGGPDPEALARVLRALGHAVTLRSGLGAPSAPAAATPDCLRNLRHSFLAVTAAGAVGSNSTLIVDPRYRDQFIVAASTPAYDALLASIPPVFVGCAARVASLTEALCAEMAAAFAARGVALPPWRRPAAMLTKWRPRRSEDVAAMSAFACAGAVPPADTTTTLNTGAARRRASVAEAAAAATARGRPATGPAPAPAALAAARAASLLASQLSSERSGGWVSRRDSVGHDHPPPPARHHAAHAHAAAVRACGTAAAVWRRRWRGRRSSAPVRRAALVPRPPRVPCGCGGRGSRLPDLLLRRGQRPRAAGRVGRALARTPARRRARRGRARRPGRGAAGQARGSRAGRGAGASQFGGVLRERERLCVGTAGRAVLTP